MKHLFISDPLDSMEENESTKLFIAEALKRGHEVDSCEVKDLCLDLEGPKANGHLVDSYDVVWIRKDPPVDRMYLEHVQILAQAKNPFFVNDPLAVLRYGDKLAAFGFAEFCPDTLVTTDRALMTEFITKFGTVMVKPLNSFSGKGVYKVTDIDEVEFADHFLILQEFLPNVVQGDLIIHLAGGELMEAMRRVPAEGSVLANIHAGGRAEAVELDNRLMAIADKMAKELLKEGVFFAGIDIIDGFLNEINVTSPGVIHETNQVMGVRLQEKLFDLLEKHV